MYHCPDDPTGVDSSVTPPRVPISYAINPNIGLFSLSAQNAPASTVMLSEVQGAQADITNILNDMGNWNTPSSPAANGGDGGGTAAGTGFMGQKGFVGTMSTN